MRDWITNRLKEIGETKASLGRALDLPYARVHEVVKGTRELKVTELPIVAQFLKMPLPEFVELYTGVESQTVRRNLMTVPLVSWVSAGQLTEQAPVVDFDEFPPVETAGLPKGNWIALRVSGDSMNKISPPDSIIFVDLDDRELVPNALYVVADEEGHATYKRYRPNENPPFQPASYHDVGPPDIDGAANVIGRVRRSLIDT
ncbi:hypothetical protein MXMO3_01676 [Maritalea myrionectae]|uniref:Peptidase S24/S26A/S26B/S26C domain-containing protein n=1 Tax=Maritalea myrionectae TaxID=454601 RepID=A0A2R4MDW1_9HYPH|nr:S24 family peptidase [Maritalea myrionectae]AVX04202.1 hypothetical protein MXMO3_01676 [Maritalea myrionectae]